MKTMILEGSDSSLEVIQDQMSNGLSGLRSRMRKRVRRAVKRGVPTKINVSSLKKLASEQAKIQTEILKKKALEEQKKYQKKLKAKLKSRAMEELNKYGSFDAIVDTQLTNASMAANEYLNTIPVVGNVNRGATYVLGDTPSNIVIKKGGKKLIAYGKERLVEQTNKIISKYIPQGVTEEPGVFEEYLNNNPDFNTFGKSKQELISMHPDIMYNLVNRKLKENNFESLHLPPKTVNADIKKIYYFTAGQPLYNPYNDYLYKQIINSEKQQNAVLENPDSAPKEIQKNKNIIASKPQQAPIDYSAVDIVTPEEAREIQFQNKDVPPPPKKEILLPVVGGVLVGLYFLKRG